MTTELDWQVVGKTIQVRGVINVWPGNYLKDKITDEMCRFIKQDIEKAWSGKKFKCFTFKLDVQVKRVNGPDDVARNAVGVRLAYVSRDFVKSYDGKTSGPGDDSQNWPKYISDAPENASAPEFGPPKADSKGVRKFNDWIPALKEGEQEGVFAHEFGHIMGLSDGYHDKTLEDKRITGVPIDGASADIMQDSSKPVLPETMTRLIRRNTGFGRLKESDLKCPIEISGGPYGFGVLLTSVSELTITACAPDYEPASSDPHKQPAPIHFKGTASCSAEAFTKLKMPDGDVGTDIAASLGLAAPKGSVSEPIDFTVPGKGEMKIMFGKLAITGQVKRHPDTGLPCLAETPMRLNGAPSDMFPPGEALVVSFTHKEGECPE